MQNLKGNLRLHGEKQSTILCEFIITSDNEFFTRLGEERTKRFFNDAYDFVTAKVGGEQYVVSAVVHMDEKTPHMHVAFIPVINGKDRKGNPCKRINCSEFWKGKDSYARLQDEYYDFITSRGYKLERGERGSSAEHLSVADYKLKKTEEQISELTKKISEIEDIDEIKKKDLPLNMVAIKRDDFEKISSAAKGYISTQKHEKENASLKAKCRKLCNENETLKSENDILSGNLKQLENDFADFADSVESEVALKKENIKLSLENERISNQIHILSADVQRLKTETEEKKQEISSLKKELTATQSLLKSLQEKFNKVMKFIENLNLKEKLEAFLKPKTLKR